MSLARYLRGIYATEYDNRLSILHLEPVKLQGYRWIEYLKPGGEIITNTTEIVPPVLNVLGKKYPHDVLDKMRQQGLSITALDAASVAEKLGNPRAMNVVLLGVISDKLEFSVETWLSALKMRVPKKHLELNLKAFDEGRKLAKSS